MPNTMAVAVSIFSALAIVAAHVPIIAAAGTAAAPNSLWHCVHANGSATASCFGGGPHAINSTDATEVLQAALSSSASSLLIDDIGRPWVVRPLFLTNASNMAIELQPGVHILARQDFFHGKKDSLLQISRGRNLTINGNGALLQMRRDDYAQPPRGTCPSCSNYSKAEWRTGIWLQQSDGVTLRRLNVVESGGDGMYVVDSNNTYVVDSVFDRNYRQGMSVVAAVNLTVERTVFSNTAGTAPAAGVDLEPDCPHDHMVNISFIDCTSTRNAGGGFQLYFGAYSHANEGTPAPFSVRLKNMQITGGGRYGFGFGGEGNSSHGTVSVEDSVVQGPASSAVSIFRHSGRSFAKFTNCRFIDSCGTTRADPDSYGRSCAPIALSLSRGVTSGGNVSFSNCQVVDSTKRPWLIASPGFAGVTATGMVVKNPHGCTTENLKVPATCELGGGAEKTSQPE